MASFKATDRIDIEIPHFKSPDFKPWLATVLSVLSVLMSMAAFAHAQDDTRMREAYEAQSKALKELSQQVQDLHHEVGVLRGYAEGQSKSLTVAVPVKPGSTAAPSGTFSVQIPMHVVPFKDVRPDEWTAPVPAARPVVKPVEVPAWEALGKDEKK